MSRSQQDVLRAYGVRPSRRRGQNFLLDGNLARAIAQEALDLGKRVVELGAGGGALTGPLLAGGASVVAVEIDRKLCEILTAEFGENERFQLVADDLARLDWAAVLASAGDRPVLAGNLPYVLTSKVLFALAAQRRRVAGGVFMIQKEVADRLVAEPGGRDYGILAVLLGLLFEIRTVRAVPPTVFWPRPEVDSAVVRLVPAGDMDDDEFAWVSIVVKKLFAQRRKKLRTQLRSHFGLDAGQIAELVSAVGLDAEARPEQVAPAGLRRLAAGLAGRDAD